MTDSIVKKLSTLDRFLPLWIVLAMALGLGLGRAWPGLGPALDRIKLDTVSLPIAIGLLWMMYPVLAKVRYGDLVYLRARGKMLGLSLGFNWIVGPLLMFGLAWLFLPDLPHYRTGLILIGLARCIAMVLIWNLLACGSNELAALLVALNSLFQILFYSLLGWLFITAIPAWLGLPGSEFHVSMLAIAKSVAIFLGVPVVAGALTRLILVKRRGEEWYESVFLKRLGPTALLGLLYTIVLMFAMQGSKILAAPLDVLRIALPLLTYFAVVFLAAFLTARKLGCTYEETAAIAFTAAGNNFELAIAVAVGVFGIASGEALAGVVGPLIEVPALIALVYLALWLRRRLWAPAQT
ncbi:MAG: ACR3 family arsenite efflux transporter [Myxococcales bacterium]|nr:ACR3 family arsenite efflux transporter [Myxococcales bacterium]